MKILNGIETTREWLTKKGVPAKEVDIITTEQARVLGDTTCFHTTFYRRYHWKYTGMVVFNETFKDGWVVDIVDGAVVYPDKIMDKWGHDAPRHANKRLIGVL